VASTSVGVVVTITLAIRGCARRDCDGLQSIVGFLLSIQDPFPPRHSSGSFAILYLRSCLELMPDETHGHHSPHNFRLRPFKFLQSSVSNMSLSEVLPMN
jgi:hypothetical protein